MCDKEEDEYGDLDLLDKDGVPIGKGVEELEKHIKYSGYTFTHAQIDLRHINYGTLPDGKYKEEKDRTSYDKDDVIQFLKILHGMYKDVPDEIGSDENGEYYRYREEIDSPIIKNKDIEHLLVFDVYEDFDDLLISITLFIED